MELNMHTHKHKQIQTFVAFLCLVLSTTGCSMRAAPPPPPPAADGLTLAERLAAEAAARPAGTPRVEDVAVALKRAGVAVGPFKQVLARTVGARFCMAGVTPEGMGVAVCEFGDAKDAARGLEYSHRAFDPLIPGRRLERNGHAVMTLTPSTNRQAARAAAAFASL